MSSSSGSRKPAELVLYLILFLVMSGFGIVLPFLLLQHIAETRRPKCPSKPYTSSAR